MAPGPLIGRERELARLDALLDGGGALLLRGPRGIGVSALLTAAAARAQARGMRVLRASGVEWESGFPYAVLDQLLRPLRRAAPEALDDVIDGPTLVCVDDLQWVDPETCAALAATTRATLLFGGHEAGPAGVEELRVGPLDPVAAAQLLGSHLPVLVRERILRESEGRPLALVELPAAYAAADDGELLGSWAPLTPALEEAFGAEGLPGDTATAMLVAALDDGGRVPDILSAASAVAGRPLAVGVLEPAFGLIELDGERLSFRHPLIRAAVRGAADPAARRAGHEAFAEAVVAHDPDRAVWHRVVGASGLDARLATELEAVAWRSREKGDYERAAAGLRRAALLTPPGPPRSARFAAAAQLAYEIGGVDIADRLLDQAAPGELDALGRARSALLRARATDALVASARDADPELAARLLWRAATELHARGGDSAKLVATGASDRGAVGDAALRGFVALVGGDSRVAVELLVRAAHDLRSQRRRTWLGQVLALSAWARIATGDLDGAEGDGSEALRTCDQPLWGAAARTALATVAALRGEEEEAERYAADAERVALPVRASSVLALVQQARGLNALGAGRPAEAFAHLRRTFDPTDPACANVPFATLREDLAEAASTEPERAIVRALGVDSPYAAFVLDEGAVPPPIGEPFLHARAQLVHGMRLRRRRHVAQSREPLRAAAAAFAALGARPWTERAQRELAATVEHREDVLDRLTPRELEIARLAARGMTNPAIAADLALSPRTVGHHLAKVFPKLDVSSRAGIGAALERLGY